MTGQLGSYSETSYFAAKYKMLDSRLTTQVGGLFGFANGSGPLPACHPQRRRLFANGRIHEHPEDMGRHSRMALIHGYMKCLYESATSKSRLLIMTRGDDSV